MDVLHVSISAITSEYINIVKNWQEEDLELAGEYLVLAATLYRYKVRALLPKEEQVMEEDDELRDDMLDQRQREYERFRQLAEELRWREQQSSFRFPGSDPLPKNQRKSLNTQRLASTICTGLSSGLLRRLAPHPPIFWKAKITPLMRKCWKSRLCSLIMNTWC